MEPKYHKQNGRYLTTGSCIINGKCNAELTVEHAVHPEKHSAHNETFFSYLFPSIVVKKYSRSYTVRIGVHMRALLIFTFRNGFMKSL